MYMKYHGIQVCKVFPWETEATVYEILSCQTVVKLPNNVFLWL